MIRKRNLLFLDLYNYSMSGVRVKVRRWDFGVILDQFLNFNDHITDICRNTQFQIRNIKKIKNLLSYDAYSTIIHGRTY